MEHLAYMKQITAVVPAFELSHAQGCIGSGAYPYNTGNEVRIHPKLESITQHHGHTLNFTLGEIRVNNPPTDMFLRRGRKPEIPEEPMCTKGGNILNSTQILK